MAEEKIKKQVLSEAIRKAIKSEKFLKLCEKYIDDILWESTHLTGKLGTPKEYEYLKAELTKLLPQIIQGLLSTLHSLLQTTSLTPPHQTTPIPHPSQ